MDPASAVQVHPKEALFASNTCPASQNHLAMQLHGRSCLHLAFSSFDFFTVTFSLSFWSTCFAGCFQFLWDRVLEMGRVRFPSWDDLLAVSRQHLRFPRAVSPHPMAGHWPALSQCPVPVWSHRESGDPLTSYRTQVRS